MAASNIYTNLPTGKKIPLLGLGTWQANPEEVREAVKTAIDCGYRHIDCAYMYQNEQGIGEGIKAKIDDGTIKRDDIFVTGKLWLTHNHPDHVEENCRESLSDLGLDFIDLYLIHLPTTAVSGQGLFPLDADGFLIENANVDYVDTWRAMETLVDKGLVRAIGVSNFTAAQIQRVLDLPPKHPVATNQIENHPVLAQPELVDFCKKHGITVTAYSPLGTPGRPSAWQAPDDPVLMKLPLVCEIASKHGVSPAQVLIRFQLQRGVIAVPKSANPGRIKQNFQSLTFQLTAKECQRLSDLNTGHRLMAFPMAAKMNYYPFKKP